ncbi:hypothetical protein KSS87_005637 [Heliosperma pusillum]|nr:hypothetical protein KSS87_005637 [Heliosperma pusillum]
MATSDSASPSLSSVLSLSPSKKEDLSITKSKLDELIESRSEISTRIQSLKQDLQNWRTKLETQVNSHREELTELRKSLDVEVTQLKSEFQELRTTLQQQQEDVTTNLRNLGKAVVGERKRKQQEEMVDQPRCPMFMLWRVGIVDVAIDWRGVRWELLQDPPKEAETTSASQVDDDTSSTEAKQLESSNGRNSAEDSTIDRNETEIVVSAT